MIKSVYLITGNHTALGAESSCCALRTTVSRSLIQLKRRGTRKGRLFIKFVPSTVRTVTVANTASMQNIIAAIVHQMQTTRQSQYSLVIIQT